MATGVTFGGVVSGLDTSAIIVKMLDAERIPLQGVERKKAELGARASAIDSVSSKIQSLLTALRNLPSAQALELRKSIPPASGAAVEVTLGAPVGTHRLVVNSLAARDTILSGGFASRSATGIGTGTLALNVGGAVTTVAIGSGQDSLDGIRDAINASGTGAIASVINDGSGSPWKLMVYSATGGAAQTVSLDASGLSGGSGISAARVVTGADASISIDGVAVVSATNDVRGVLDGVTLHLTGTTAPAGVEFTIQRDDDAAAARLRSVVDAYNSARRAVADAVAPGGTLTLEVAARSVLSRLRGALSTSGSAGGVETLSEIGLATSRDGTMSLDAAKLSAALATRGTEVDEFLSAPGGFVESLKNAAEELANSASGTLARRSQSLRRQAGSLDIELSRLQERLDRRETALRSQFTAMEAVLSRMRSQTDALTSLSSTTWSK